VKIHVVMSTSGAYEEREERMVRAFRTEERAAAFVVLCREQQDAALTRCKPMCCGEERYTPFCPECGAKTGRIDPFDLSSDPAKYGLTADPKYHTRIGSDTVSYYVETVEMEE
jgi:hypothetical protein